MPFPSNVKEDALVFCGRYCCICHKFCGTKIEVHHIREESEGGNNTAENAIPLCFDCHADMRSYDHKHPKGNKLSESELKRHRDSWYKKVAGNIGVANREEVGSIPITTGETVEKSTTKPSVFTGAPSTTKPSTFLQPNETFIDTTSRFQMVETKVFLPDTQHYFLRLIPSIPLTNIKNSKQALDRVQSSNLRPLGESYVGTIYGTNKYGSYVGCLEDDKILNITQLFITGELWGIDAYAIDKDRLMKWSKVGFGYFPCTDLEKTFISTLSNYLKFASETLKLQLPLRFIAGATDVEGYKMPPPQGFEFSAGRYDGHVLDSHIEYKGTITNYSESVQSILLPFFKYVWEMCSLDRPDIEAHRRNSK